ncbi:nucleotidyltransferase domain-containing protein [Natrononativus amylolyticus]|uniref:nucleotidyltransferase domain-containing protein n=1 Tax=Natrononativus amylolyticus TaxID=2963434 RepID=UPI0020CFD1F2|nr:nucleotidyltransferase domain-containing protein [Natrononativus amylolyticus]
MDASDGRSRVLAALEESVCSDPHIEFAVAFGSQVTGEPTLASDLDVAIRFADSLSSHERFQRRCFLSGDLQQEDAPFVDLSDIEELPLDVAHDAVHGYLVCGDEQAFQQCREDIEAAFSERRDDLRRQRHDVIDRIAEGGLRG